MSIEVQKMFSEISHKYDLLNDVLSLGIHRLWRRKLIKMLAPEKTFKALDLACGTGEVSFALEKKCGEVTGTDFCEDMIIISKEKAKIRSSNVNFQTADALNLPFDDEKFDCVTIAYGIRNVDSTEKCLSEMARMIKSGQKIAVLEFGSPKGIIGGFYKFYSKNIMPLIGKIISGSDFAYTYLPETAAKYPCGDDFINIMKKTELFAKQYYKKLSFGIAFIYIGVKK